MRENSMHCMGSWHPKLSLYRTALAALTIHSDLRHAITGLMIFAVTVEVGWVKIFHLPVGGDSIDKTPIGGQGASRHLIH